MQLRDLFVESGRIVRFGLVGLAVTLVYATVAIGLNEVLGVTPVLASIIGQCAAVGLSYVGHSSITFRVETNHRDFLWRFVVLAAFSFSLAALLTWLVADAMKLSPRIAFAAVTVVVPIFNYLCNRLWVFTPGLAGAAARSDLTPAASPDRPES